MPTLVERLRHALRPDYEIQEELGRGGMGIVYRARDVQLDRLVAIKIVRPELATAHATERFLREARLLAQLTHPNVVPVFRAGEAGGIPYYAMAFQEGETLAARLAHGPLAPAQALKIGRDILDALESVHRVGIIHRDLKPSNVFLDGDRALIGDFGIARPSTSPITDPRSQPAGTPGYMPPEQAFGWDLSPQTDLYAAAMVLYEAFTGHRWRAWLPDEKPDWSGVPAPVVPVLRRGLAWDPRDRWPDAATFRRRLWRTRQQRYRRRAFALTAAALVVGAVAVALLTDGRAVTIEVAVVPFDAEPGLDSLAAELTGFTRMNLAPLGVASEQGVTAWWEARGQRLDMVTDDAMADLGARYLAHATVRSRGNDTVVRVTVIDTKGRRRDGGEHVIGGRTLAQKGHLVGYHIARILHPTVEAAFRVLPDVSDPAVSSLIAGYQAFERNAFATATERFDRALQLDSSFALAAWWLSNAWRWLATGEPHPNVDLAEILARRSHTLFDLDRRLIEAQLTPDLTGRLAAYERVLDDYPNYAYAAFLYAAESQDRGPYVGVSLETVAERLEAAVALDSTFGPAWGHLVWTSIRLGRRQETMRAYERYQAVSAPPDQMEIDQPSLLGFTINERFFPQDTADGRAALFANPAVAADLARAFRLAAMFGLHTTQLAVARALGNDPRLHARERAGIAVAEGLALWALGEREAALAAFDTAAARFDAPEAELQAAGWRVLPGILRLPPLSPEEVDAGRVRLRQLMRHPAARVRAAWLLGHDALAHDRTVEAREWRAVLGSVAEDSGAARLGRLLDADRRATDGDVAAAVAMSRGLLAYDSAGRGGDPFARAVLHTRRAAWLEALDRPAAADSALRWYEGFEWTGGYPSGVAQTSEVDWALAPWITWARGVAAERHGDRRAACRQYARVLPVWNAAPGLAGLLSAEAAAWSGKRCR